MFDFIRPEVARSILDAQIAKIVSRLREENRIDLTLAEPAREAVFQRVLENLDNGGRGIGNIVESMLINPLARWLFEHPQERKITIADITCDEEMVTLAVE